eukprot:199645-Chlamydomonas_euryale.AAC.2
MHVHVWTPSNIHTRTRSGRRLPPSGHVWSFPPPSNSHIFNWTTTVTLLPPLPLSGRSLTAPTPETLRKHGGGARGYFCIPEKALLVASNRDPLVYEVCTHVLSTPPRLCRDRSGQCRLLCCAECGTGSAQYSLAARMLQAAASSYCQQ